RKTASILGAVVGKFHGDGGAGRHLGAGGNILVGGRDVGTILVGTGDQEVEAVALGILLGVDQGHAGEVRHLHGLVGRFLAEVEHHLGLAGDLGAGCRYLIHNGGAGAHGAVGK